MFVYVTDEGSIFIRTEERNLNLLTRYKEYQTNYKMTDRIIFEDNQIKLYEYSRQYDNDTNKYHMQKEIDELSRKNEDLTKIANIKVTKELELDKQGTEADAYQRQLYLLKNMRGLQQS